ncbi:MAG: VWA domain-containing protein [Phycisphaerae bacterium]|nr:VWA domain-containing protein [Phycisphaerae bacterium]
MTWQDPSVWFLWALLVVPLLLGWWLGRRRRAVKFSSTEIAGSLHTTLRVRLRWLPNALRLGVVVLLILAVARPQKGREQTKIYSEGIAIEMLVDRSGSMRAMDFQLAGRPVDRLTAVKDVAGKFITGGEGLAGRPNDMIGMISFARYADNVSPLTLDHGYLSDKLRNTEIVTERSEDGTAVGEAIGLGVERLRSLAEQREKDNAPPIQSQVLILLTDGENNAGDLDPIAAARIAKTLGVRIYTIGVGTKGRAPIPVVNPFTGKQQMQWMRVSIDEKTLRDIAKATGGKYFRATDTDSLRNIYARIDAMEKTKIDERRFADYRQWAIQPIHAGMFTLPPLVLLAFVLLVIEAILRNTYLRRIT